MCSGTRACIAYVAGRVISGAAGSYLHDHAEARDLNIGGTVKGSRIGLYDYERKCGFAGTLPCLFDDGTSAPVILEIDGNLFKGRDGASGHHFSGSVVGTLICVLEHASGRDFRYSL